MVSQSLCRCICGAGTKEHLDSHRAWGPPPPELDLDPDAAGSWSSRARRQKLEEGLLSYSISVEQPLRGVPIREGELWHLSTEDKVEAVSFSLFVNGFSFVQPDEQETRVSLSPFSLVRNCKFQSAYPAMNLASFKIFKVSLFCQSMCFYFGVREEDERRSEEERSRWVLDISRAMRLVTQSLFPPFMVLCRPLDSVASTQRRLMSGYLIHHEGPEEPVLASVLYCELHPHSGDKAKLKLYENELCIVPVMDIYITEHSLCCEKIGINCSCFSIEDHQFSSRTLAERKLWLRAISNLKVKLQNRAPSPTNEDLRNYRTAIEEHVLALKGMPAESHSPRDALLQPCARRAQSSAAAGSSALRPIFQEVPTFDTPAVQRASPGMASAGPSAQVLTAAAGAAEADASDDVASGV